VGLILICASKSEKPAAGLGAYARAWRSIPPSSRSFGVIAIVGGWRGADLLRGMDA